MSDCNFRQYRVRSDQVYTRKQVRATPEFQLFPQLFKKRPKKGERDVALVIAAGARTFPREFQRALEAGEDIRNLGDPGGHGMGFLTAMCLASEYDVIGSFYSSRGTAMALELTLRSDYFNSDARMYHLDTTDLIGVREFAQYVRKRHGFPRVIVFAPSVQPKPHEGKDGVLYFEPAHFDQAIYGNALALEFLLQELVPKGLKRIKKDDHGWRMRVGVFGSISDDIPSWKRRPYPYSKSVLRSVVDNWAAEWTGKGLYIIDDRIAIANTSRIVVGKVADKYTRITAEQSSAGRMILPIEGAEDMYTNLLLRHISPGGHIDATMGFGRQDL